MTASTPWMRISTILLLSLSGCITVERLDRTTAPAGVPLFGGSRTTAEHSEPNRSSADRPVSQTGSESTTLIAPDPGLSTSRVGGPEWDDAVTLDNGILEVRIAPGIGRITSIRFKGERNLLRMDEARVGTPPGIAGTFTNYGGDWLWPVAQSRWTEMADADWPPPEILADAPWRLRSWINTDGSRSCLLMRRFAHPVAALVTRAITLDSRRPRIRIRQRMLRLGASELPVSLWNVTQVDNPDRIFMPVDPTGESAFRTLLFGAPPDSHVALCDDTLVYDPTLGGQYKIGSQGEPHWIAAQVGRALILEQAIQGTDGPFPDGGCAVEMYSNTESGYAEIETLSREIALEAGEHIENVLVIDCRMLSDPGDPCEIADALRTMLDARLLPNGS